jgi:ribosome-associated heat shock protein Hsp15
VSEADSLRLDKWLWYARFFKSRTTASRLCAAGRVRINRRVVDKAHATLRAGDVLTFPQARAIRVVRVRALGTRRGPAAEAVTLYEDLAPPEAARSKIAAPRAPGAGRPTKSDRRAIERLKGDA